MWEGYVFAAARIFFSHGTIRLFYLMRLVENGSVRLSIILRKDRLNSDGQQIQQ